MDDDDEQWLEVECFPSFSFSSLAERSVALHQNIPTPIYLVVSSFSGGTDEQVQQVSQPVPRHLPRHHQEKVCKDSNKAQSKREWMSIH